ncbi:MAG TPA: site-specific integrase [Trueperaceae bacterium]
MAKSNELSRSLTSSLERARSLLSMSSEDRRHFAARAVNERDHQALWELTEAYLTRRQVSRHTISSYRKGVMTLLDAWSGVNLLRPRREDAELYVLDLMAPDRPVDANDRNKYEDGRRLKYKPLSPASVRSRVSAAKALYDALRWTEVTDADPFDDVTLPKLRSKAVERAREKSYTPQELAMMAKVCNDWDDRLILLLGAHGGLRASEMLALRWEDVDLHRGRLTVKFGKGGTTASVTMSEQLLENLRKLRGALFPAGRASGFILDTRSRSSLYKRLERLWTDAFVVQGKEVPPFTKGVHGLRHHAGVAYARETSDLRKVRDHLRHASMSSTEVYMAAAEGTNEVRGWRIGFDDD